jgi:hypothetical protein
MFAIAFVLVLIENNYLIAKGGSLKPAACVLPMEVEGLIGEAGVDNPIADLARVDPAGVRFFLSIKNKVSGTLIIKPNSASPTTTQRVMADIVFGNDEKSLITIPYDTERPITNQIFGLKADKFYDQIIGKSVRCNYRFPSGQFIDFSWVSTSSRIFFEQDNGYDFKIVARPTLAVLTIHFLLFVAALFGILKLVEAMKIYILGDHHQKKDRIK